VVWALRILGRDQQLLQSLTFKGGTSVSKAHGLIDRFSEDVDLTVNIQHLWPDVDLAPAVNPSQAERRRKAADSKLKQWVREIPMPLLQGAVSAADILEKAAAIHVSCRKGRWGSGEGDRYSRHWYDLDRLARAGIAEAAVRDRTLAAEVAQHKEDFWRAMDADEQPIDYLHALSGNLQLVPTDAARQALESDYTAMADSGMLRGEFPSFPELLARISQLEEQCNAIARSLA
jgi:hypothetical protein